MSLLDQIKDFFDGDDDPQQHAGPMQMAEELLGKTGGPVALLAKLKDGGLGDTVQSWLGMGENQPVDPAALKHALGDDTVNDLASKFGGDADGILQKLAGFLPRFFDKASPHGTIDDDNAVLGMLKDLLGKVGGK
jgi:uncharacterized protein YidB (DUF937 family)